MVLRAQFGQPERRAGVQNPYTPPLDAHLLFNSVTSLISKHLGFIAVLLIFNLNGFVTPCFNIHVVNISSELRFLLKLSI